VVAGLEAAGNLLGHEQAADRQPVREPFGQRDQVRPDAELLEREERPVRPIPVWISSRQSSAPSSSASAAAAARNSVVAGTTPPSPWIGSSRINPVSGVTAARRDSTSLSRAKVTPGSSGSNAARFAGCPVTASEPAVRPWNEPSSAITPGLPVALRAYLTAASIASAPELPKYAWAPPKRSESRPASSTIGAVQ
jgi:hypothetical protein